MHKYIKNSGFTLIELMLSISLSLLFIVVLVNMYQSYLKSESIQASLYHLQQQSVNASEILTTETRKAGYMGCAKLSNDFPVAELPPYTIRPGLMVSPTTLMIRYVDFPGATLMRFMQDYFTLEVSGYTRYRTGDILVVADCTHVDIFQVKKIYFYAGNQKIITTKPLSHLYQPMAEVGKLVKHTFFVAETRRHHMNGSSIFALYRQDLRGVKTAMVDDIESMQISVQAPQVIAIKLRVASALFKRDQYVYAFHAA